MSIDFAKYRLPLQKANIYYIPNFFSKEEADAYLSDFMANITFDQKENEGRRTALHGHAERYRYALNDAVPAPWTENLTIMRRKIESIITNAKYDVCLLNYYANGKERFAFHADREELGNPVPITSVSLGAERKFYFRSQNDPLEEYSVFLGHGSLLIMGDGTHENYVHSLPRDKAIKDERLNLTFRQTRPITGRLDLITKLLMDVSITNL